MYLFQFLAFHFLVVESPRPGAKVTVLTEGGRISLDHRLQVDISGKYRRVKPGADGESKILPGGGAYVHHHDDQAARAMEMRFITIGR